MVTALLCVISAAGSSIIGLTFLVRWIAYLRFLRWLVQRTGRSESLRDAAEAASAFNGHRPAAPEAFYLIRPVSVTRSRQSPWKHSIMSAARNITRETRLGLDPRAQPNMTLSKLLKRKHRHCIPDERPRGRGLASNKGGGLHLGGAHDHRFVVADHQHVLHGPPSGCDHHGGPGRVHLGRVRSS
jgi:hypothetical protein